MAQNISSQKKLIKEKVTKSPILPSPKTKKPEQKIKYTETSAIIGICGYDFHNPREEQVKISLCKYCNHYFCKDHNKALIPPTTVTDEKVEKDKGHPCTHFIETRKLELQKEIERDTEELERIAKGPSKREIGKAKTPDKDEWTPKAPDKDEWTVHPTQRKIAIGLGILLLILGMGLLFYILLYVPQ